MIIVASHPETAEGASLRGSRSGVVEDAWSSRFEIRCEGDVTIVTSRGPDKVSGTEDDIQVR
jgi:hypothetical protein